MGPIAFDFEDMKKYEKKTAVDSIAFAHVTKGTEHLLVRPGLFGEGTCTNPGCEFVSRRTVCNLGMGKFNMGVQENELKCPKCANDIPAEAWGVASCKWKFMGYKVNTSSVPGGPAHGSKAEKVQSKDWIFVRDGYFMFDGEDRASYTGLEIETASLY
jgi:hypothetical protein